MRQFAAILLLCACFLNATYLNAANALEITDGSIDISVAEKMLFLEDYESNRQFDELYQAYQSGIEFQPHAQYIQQKHDHNSPVWSALTLVYRGDQPTKDLVISPYDPTFLLLDFYRTEAGGDVYQIQSGTIRPYSTREQLDTPLFTFNLTLKPNVPMTLMFRTVAYSRSADNFRNGVQLRTNDVDLNYSRIGSLIIGMVYGSLFALGIYHFILWLMTRIRAISYFVGFQAALVIVLFGVDGTGYMAVWPNSPIMQNSGVGLVAAMVMVFNTLLINALCDWNHRYPILYRFIWLGIAGSALIYMWGISFEESAQYILRTYIEMPFTLGVVLLQIILLGFSIRDQNPYAKVLIVSQLVFILGASCNWINDDPDREWLARTLLYYGLHIGVLLKTILLAMVVAKKITLDQAALLSEKMGSERAYKAADKIKDDFLSLISHELRTPLVSIQSSLSMLREHTNEQRKPWIELADAGNDRIRGVVDKLLLFIDLSNDKIKLNEQAFSADDIRSSLLKSNRELDDSARLVWNVDPNMPVMLGDLALIGNSLGELLGNGLKFGAGQPVQINIAYDGNTKQLVLSVSDQGIGFSSQDLNNLQQAFKQSDAGMKRQFEGLGLGLTLSAKIIEVLGGELDLANNEGDGATVTMRVPVKITSDKSLQQTAPPISVNKSQLKILVVEDNLTNQMILIKTLERLGHQALGAPNGKEALSLFSEHQDFDCVLMDLQMPVMDGFETTEKLRGLPAGKAVPIIAVTANVLESDRERCLAAGMNGFVPKPFTLESLDLALSKQAVFSA